ncbi:Putative purine-cytosine permease [Septoria linicola]|uniref:Purine-cytosine permease n=1 Tax=Septoria linicola TaxID=215465 RepID=A0A9Q9EML1_9PEZI|nr:putative purine-cytosine permease [Septoria linicola]USW56911.1 Putative purine-cytosine permease [Septoria linicola]
MANDYYESDVERHQTSADSDVSRRKNSHEPRFWRNLMSWDAIEETGVQPVPVCDRTETRVIGVFTLWFTLSTNLLPIVTGMVGTLSFGLRLRDASLVILFFSLLSTTPTAWLATLGPATGMRQMIQARYSFGYYLVSLPVLLNLATLTGFCVIDSVVGGLTLSSVNSGQLTPTAGIVIIGLIGLIISFCGFRVLHYFERYAWIPAVLAIVIATGYGGRHLQSQVVVETTSAAAILSFGALVAGFLIPWAALASDFATYMPPSTPKSKTFAYTYAGLFLPTVPLMVLGAAIGGAVPNVPSWQAGYDQTSVGGVLAAMLEPAGGFGKFLVVVLSLTLLGNIAATMYAITLNLQLLVPWLVRVPRAAFAIVITAIVIPVSVEAAKSFFVNLENFIGVIGYWSAAFVAVVGVVYAWFRRSDTTTYDAAIWDSPKSLPLGLAAVGAALCSITLIVPSMAQIWYTGPIGAITGDLGFEMAFLVTTVLYLPFRHIEKHFTGR